MFPTFPLQLRRSGSGGRSLLGSLLATCRCTAAMAVRGRCLLLSWELAGAALQGKAAD